MTGLVKRFGKNAVGRDFVVGDIHGHFTELQDAIDRIGFNPECDRLFSVGDLVDRGPECEKVLEWLDKPWFHPVRGNHDDYVCRYDTCEVFNWMRNGGLWFQALVDCEKAEFAAWFRDLPIAIEVGTDGGKIGIVHASIPGKSWDLAVAGIEGGFDGGLLRNHKNFFMWSRERYETQDNSVVSGVLAIVVGHTPVNAPEVLGNVVHIDTAGWRQQAGGYFTLLDIGDMKAHMVMVDECKTIDLSKVIK